MKITTYFSVAAMMAMLAANTSCTKEETIAPEENKNIITLNVSTETLSRISLTEEGDSGSEEVKVKWEKGDVLEVWAREAGEDIGYNPIPGTKIAKFTLAYGEGTKNAVFSGTLPNNVQPEYLNVIYRKNLNTNVLKEKNSEGAFQCEIYPQKLTTTLDDAPLALGGVFKKQGDKYSPIGGKILYGGSLFKISLKGLAVLKGVKSISYSRAVDLNKHFGISSRFNIDNNEKVIHVLPQGDNKAARYVETAEGETITTTSNGELTFYSFITPFNASGKTDTDIKVTVTYNDDTIQDAGVITLIGKTMEYGKCYTVTLDATDATAQ